MPRSIYSLTAEQLAPDILALLEMHRRDEIHEAVVRQVLKGACWWVSNAQGRNDACDRWSTAALQARRNAGSWQGLNLIHEHIVPRNVIEEAILSLPSPSKDEIVRLLKQSQVCVVTEEEDLRLRELGLRSKMPDEIDDLRIRYKLAEIEIAERPFRRN